ncbi:MAG: hypothetical protein DMG31_15075 [Acidobacteria bacterium]|nr:MAG: hypothetical protein DMG31_15075 [Acidobacteriota bacterium]
MLVSLNQYRDRLRHVTWDECRVRVGQELAKRWDALLFSRLPRTIGFQAESSGNFFFSAEQLSPIVTFLRQRMPEAIEATIVQAERICRHEFDLLGYEGLHYGPEIDWHLDAVSGKSAPRKLWFKIHYLDYSEVGDVKVTWELNRHQHLVTLAKAYCFTGDDRYVLELIRQWYAWQQNNPYPIGVNWASSLEVAFRSLSWLWILHLLQRCPLATSQFRCDLQRGLALGGRHIARYLSTYFSPNTHLLGEGVALFFLGVLCNSKSSAQWQQRGWDIVLAQAKRQVQLDGMHFEQSTYYHVYALDLFLHARILATRNRIYAPEKFDRVLRSMLEALCFMSRGGMPPCFGDDDGGRLFDPRRNRVEQLLDPLVTGSLLFGCSDFKAAKPDLVEETVWLLGPQKALGFDATSISAPPQLESVAFRSSGLYLMMFSGKPTARLTIDAGPQGAGGGGHSHADALSIQVAVEGRDVLVDPGTFVYAGAGPERQVFRGTAYHNTLQVDGIDQAEPAGPFPWRSLPDVHVEKWTAGSSFDLLVARHRGYARLPDPVIHRRYVFGLKSHFWLVLDEPEGKGNHRADVLWHLASNLHWRLQLGSALATWDEGGLALLFADTKGWVPHIEEGWYSPVYGNRKRSEVLVFRHEGKLQESFATVLLPLGSSSHNLGILTRVHQSSSNNRLRVYRYDRSAESHFFFFPLHQPWRYRELGSDGEFLYYSISESGNKRLIVCGATYVKFAGETVMSSSRALSSLEWSAKNGDASFSCSDESAICSTSWHHLTSLERLEAEVSTV